MKVLLIVLLAVVVCQGLQVKKLSTQQQSRIQEMKKQTNTWAGILMNLAELHMMSKGPLEELVAAIQDTVNDLGYKREKRDGQYVKRTNEHNALVTKLEADIANAETDIQGIMDLLEMLAEQKAAIEEENKRKVQENANSRQQLKEQSQIRIKSHEEFMTKVAETEEALSAVEECLTILNDFAMGGASFAQVKKGKVILAETQKKIAKLENVEGAFLSALITVASEQEFANSEAIMQVVGKFNEIKNNLYDSIGKLNADEAMAQSDYDKFVSDTKGSITENDNLIAYNNGLLEENAANTEENTNLLYQRRADKASFEEALQDEHNSFNDATDRYNSWCAENDREVAVCNEALDVVSKVDFAGYIGDRVGAEDGLVSSGMATSEAHGKGTEVFNFDYQF